MIIWVLFNVSYNSRNKRSFVSLRYLFYKSFINHQICNNNHEIHIDTSDKKKIVKKFKDSVTIDSEEGTLLLSSRDPFVH